MGCTSLTSLLVIRSDGEQVIYAASQCTSFQQRYDVASFRSSLLLPCQEFQLRCMHTRESSNRNPVSFTCICIYIYAYVGHCRTTDEEVHVEHAGIQTRWLRCFYLSLNRLPTSSKPVDLQVMRLAEDLLNSLEMGWAKTL